MHALLLPDGAFVLTVTVDAAPAVNVPGEHVRTPLDIEQPAPELWDEMAHVSKPPAVGSGSLIVTPVREAAPALALFFTVTVKDAVPPSV
jgi:hypothetical protein